MSERSPNTQPTQSRIDRLKLAARKTGAVAEAALVSVTGVAAMDAMVDASPAHASAEAAATYEAQGGKAYINGFNVKFTRVAKAMHSSPNFKNIHSKSLDAQLGGHYEFWTICEPSGQYAGRYDCLDVAMKKGQAVPDSASLYLGADSKSAQKVKNWEHGYYLATTANAGLGKWLALEEDPGSAKMDQAKNYYVSAGGYPGVSKEDATYDKDSQAVSAAYNDFLKHMKALIAEK